MRVLVVHGSKRGGTAGLAAMVADALRDRGLEVEVAAAGDVRDPSPYDAVIVGGALYAGRWHGDARRFVRRHARVLSQRPVWLFSSGPLDDSASDGRIPPVPHVVSAMERVGARGRITFGGMLSEDATGFPAAAMARTMAGDHRDAAQVAAWAGVIADALGAPRTTDALPG